MWCIGKCTIFSKHGYLTYCDSYLPETKFVNTQLERRKSPNYDEGFSFHYMFLQNIHKKITQVFLS